MADKSGLVKQTSPQNSCATTSLTPFDTNCSDIADTSKKVSLNELKLTWPSVDSSQYDPESESKVAVLYTGGTIGMKSHGHGMCVFLMPELSCKGAVCLH